jgi:Predicted membrane protein (DUF2142)
MIGARAGRSKADRSAALASPRATRLRRPSPAFWIALVACLNAACWSIVSPPFQVTDEPAHFAYVKQLAETRRLPRTSQSTLSPEEEVALTDLHFLQVGAEAGRRPIASQAEQDRLQSDLAEAARLPRDGSQSAGVATSEPPLYYALEAVPYAIAYDGTVLDRLQLMRLFSTLMAGFTALFAYLFTREALPGEPWAWTTAGLGIALTPLLGSLSGAVNPDAMLFAVSGALFFCLARAFRRGLTKRLAGAIALVIAAGLLTKLNFIGLLPGAVVGLAILARRLGAGAGLGLLRRAAPAFGIAVSPLLVAVAAAVLTGNVQLHAVTGGLDSFGRHGSLAARIDYIWQLYLPRLPGMSHDFSGVLTSRQLWFNGFVGLYGWADTSFPDWVYAIALIPAAAIAGLCVKALLDRRAALRGRAGEILVYALMSLGVIVMVAIASYSQFPNVDAEFGRARYLFPMLALLGAVLALAARGAGRRWGPSAGALIVVLALAHDVFSQLLVVSHYYL